MIYNGDRISGGLLAKIDQLIVAELADKSMKFPWTLVQLNLELV